MAKLQLDILSNTNADRNNAQIYTDLQLDLALDYTYNNQLEKNRQVLDLQANNNLGAIFNSISNIITTNPGQKPLNPQFGVGLQEMLFQPITVDRANAIGSAILKGITTYEPRVTVININVTPVFDLHQYLIEITVSVPRFSTQQVKFVGTLDKSGFFKN